MRRVGEDPMTGDVTYEVGNGRFIKFDRRSLREYGLEALMRAHDLDVPTERLDVIQSGRKIGTVPATFEPMSVKSTSFFYEVRGTDFKREGDVWIADRMLGPGDLEAVPGFVWDRG